ncbi:hypothetical protein LS482_17100 [Sinomicrobium kalidii]|uniref:helix-turn-helix transcriptional regulator n=1 Tax=Sinomicrobium kalidii TaxID=2900738 RepID=UPI001E3F6B3C|nr:hypothetical protein [Sinomicrobium kalidii]UGU15386.1 hypothetical protein LS482_17100 [Sinomicrobium kalidii]
MFRTQIHQLTFIFIVIESLLLIFLLLQKNNPSKFRFVLLTFLFLSYNITSGLIPDEKLGINRLSQDYIAFTVGIACALYLLYYIYTEYKIKPPRIISMRPVLYIAVLDFIFLFVIPYSITDDLNLSRNLFLLVPLLLTITIVVNVFVILIKRLRFQKNNYQTIRGICGMGGAVCLMSLPAVIIIFGDNQPIEHTSFSMGHIFLTIAYITSMNQKSRIPEKNLSKNPRLPLFDKLTDREKEIAMLIIENPKYTYQQLSASIHINDKTFSKHVSNIYKKLELPQRNKEELVDFLRPLYITMTS